MDGNQHTIDLPGECRNWSSQPKTLGQLATEWGFRDAADLKAHLKTGAELHAMTPEQRDAWSRSCRKKRF